MEQEPRRLVTWSAGEKARRGYNIWAPHIVLSIGRETSYEPHPCDVHSLVKKNIDPGIICMMNALRAAFSRRL